MAHAAALVPARGAVRSGRAPRMARRTRSFTTLAKRVGVHHLQQTQCAAQAAQLCWGPCCRGCRMRGSGESCVRRCTRARRVRSVRRGAHGGDARWVRGSMPAHLSAKARLLFFFPEGVKEHLKWPSKINDAESAGGFGGGVRSSPSGSWRSWLAGYYPGGSKVLYTYPPRARSGAAWRTVLWVVSHVRGRPWVVSGG